MKKKSNTSKPRPKGSGGVGGILLPPPPGVNKATIPNSTSSPTGSFGSTSSTSLESTVTATEQHSNNSNNFHQQLLGELESLSVTDSKTKVGHSAGPLLTPANSVCTGDDFALFSSDPPTAANVISANGSSESNGSKKTDDDLWSDFESFRNENAAGNAASASSSQSVTGKFDDWAKF